MEVISYTEARAKLKEVMDRVVEDCTPTIITRQRGKPVVMISLDDWNSMDATMYLLSSPRNAARLRESIAEADAGLAVERELIDL